MAATRKQPMDEPPPVDEGWWTSVLAEEERTRPPVPPRPSRVGAEPGASKGRGAEKATEKEKEKKPEEPRLPPVTVDWERVKSLFESDQIVDLNVTGFNRGGLLVEGETIYGFVPFSHLVGLAGSEPADRDAALEAYVGKTLRLKVIECVPEDGRVVFSERAAQAEPGRRSKIFDSLQPGQRVTGAVTNVTDFGVFVDLGGVEGLIHISELSWGRVIHPNHILRVSQQVEALVLDIAAERCRVALSLKRLQPNPWETAENNFAANMVVPATVTTVVSYGAFARLDVGVEGLIHASEMPLAEGALVKDFLSEGQRVDVRVLHVDASRQRMGLSMRLDHNSS
ncbi:MAG: S1 RNA-binding domain-containing protein [Chloroflexota bacterium]